MSTDTFRENTDRVVSPYPWAPGFYPGDRPQVVTSRFQYEDGYTLERYHATGGYEGLRAALAKSPAEVPTRSRTPRCSGAAAPASPPAPSGASRPPACGRATSSSTATSPSPAPTRTASSWSATRTS